MRVRDASGASSLTSAPVPRPVREGLPTAGTHRPAELRAALRTPCASCERVPAGAAPIGGADPPVVRRRLVPTAGARDVCSRAPRGIVLHPTCHAAEAWPVQP